MKSKDPLTTCPGCIDNNNDINAHLALCDVRSRLFQAVRETREMLIKTLVDTLHYVGRGRVASNDFQAKCDCDARMANYQLAELVDDLVRKVKKL